MPMIVLQWLGRLLAAVWWIVTLPFRLVGLVVGLLGRMVGLGLGFGLMVLGVALSAGSLFLVGIPLFVLGLILSVRCIG